MDIGHVLSQGDGVTRAVALLLLLMSIVSWALLVWKTWALHAAARHIAAAVRVFWQSASLESAVSACQAHDPRLWATPLVTAGAAATAPVAYPGSLAGAGDVAARVSRALRVELARASARLHWGHVVLASVGATAPFVGLLGTVWGIFHALSGLAGMAQLTMDKVAGPVGEALIMTAAGLAVALPAVLAYNLLGRLAARLDAELEGFAVDLRDVLLTSTPSLRADAVALQTGA
jgi:biopolymer transport protein ExbB